MNFSQVQNFKVKSHNIYSPQRTKFTTDLKRRIVDGTRLKIRNKFSRLYELSKVTKLENQKHDETRNFSLQMILSRKILCKEHVYSSNNLDHTKKCTHWIFLCHNADKMQRMIRVVSVGYEVHACGKNSQAKLLQFIKIYPVVWVVSRI